MGAADDQRLAEPVAPGPQPVERGGVELQLAGAGRASVVAAAVAAAALEGLEAQVAHGADVALHPFQPVGIGLAVLAAPTLAAPTLAVLALGSTFAVGPVRSPSRPAPASMRSCRQVLPS
jgi:hypothetical protein